MNELDQAPASGQGSATDVIEREPAADQHAGSYDSPARSPRAESLADTDPSYYDGDIQAALAADDTPTRQEAARQDAIGDGHAGPGDDSSPDRDASIEAILHEDDGLPDSRTRQQAAADDLAEGASPPGEASDIARAPREDPAGSPDAGIEAILHEDDHLPDPRTRQQAAQEDAASSSDVVGEDSAATVGEQALSGPDLPETAETAIAAADAQHQDATEDWPTPEERAQLHEKYLDWRKEQSEQPDGWEQGANVVGDKPDKSPGDISDLPPTGEQLLDLEDDKRSRLDGLRREFERDEVLDGLHGEAEQDATTVQSILAARPPEGHPVQVVPDTPQLIPVTPAGIDAGMMASSGLMVGVMLIELGRGFHKILKHRKEVE
jgi:hypothetical protein